MPLDMNTIGYFLFMSEEERKARNAQENRSTDKDSISTADRPTQESKEE